MRKKFQPPKLSKKRAVDTDLKDQRRDGLLDAARFLLKEKGLETLSMQEIASLSRVAKGTLYLYFQTKEELLLALLSREFHQWVGAFDAGLVKTGASLTPKGVSAWIVESLLQRPELLLLMAHSESIIEKNISLEALIAFKLALLEDLSLVARATAPAFGLDEKRLMKGLLLVHAMIVGLYFKAFPSPVVKEALKVKELQGLSVDFAPALMFAIETLLGGGTKAADEVETRPI